MTPWNILWACMGVLACLPVKKLAEGRMWYEKLVFPASLAAFVLCMLQLAGGTYNPFIYFRF